MRLPQRWSGIHLLSRESNHSYKQVVLNRTFSSTQQLHEHWSVMWLLIFYCPIKPLNCTGILFPLAHCVQPHLSHFFHTAEFLFLLWAVYLCYAVRTVPSAFHEPRYMAIAVHNELILSAIFYVIR